MRFFVAVALTLFACFGAVIACTDDSTTTTYIPETGITVRADSITNGIGCGTGDGQIYKYVALAVNSNTPPGAPAGAVFDFFADAILANLQPSVTGSLDYRVLIFAWDEKSFDPVASQVAALMPDPSSPPADAVTIANSLLALNPTYYTYFNASTIANGTSGCIANEVINIQVIAACPPLTATSANDDGGTDGSTADASDASDASFNDAADANANDAGDSSAIADAASE